MRKPISTWVPVVLAGVISGCGLESRDPEETRTAAAVGEPDAEGSGEHLLATVAAPDAMPQQSAAAISPRFTPPACFPPWGPQNGRAICNTDAVLFLHTNGLFETFVVGTDFAIWHSWETSVDVWTAWQSLGGTVHCKNASPCSAADGVRLFNSSPTVQVKGTDNLQWCRIWPWTLGWGHC
jgi:hypothetical protein